MNITLYKATEDLRDLLDQVDPETGELPEGLSQAREIVARKAQSVTAYILNTEAQIELVKGRAKELMDAAKREEKKLAWLRQYLADNMAATGILSIKSDDGTFSAKLEQERDASVEVFDEAQLPIEYVREIPAKQEPDKKLIAKAIGDGFEVPGARLVRRDRLTLK